MCEKKKNILQGSCQRYVKWRNKHATDDYLPAPQDLIQFVRKNLWKGFFDDKFAATFILGVVFCSCISFWIELAHSGYKWCSGDLCAPLMSILPALMGMTIMDAFLWQEKSLLEPIKTRPMEQVNVNKDFDEKKDLMRVKYMSVMKAWPWFVTLVECMLWATAFWAHNAKLMPIMYLVSVMVLVMAWIVRAADGNYCECEANKNCPDPSDVIGFGVSVEVREGKQETDDADACVFEKGQEDMKGCEI